MGQKKISGVKKMGLLLSGLVFSLFLLEVILRFTDIGLEQLKYSLFYSPYDLAIYQQSPNANLIYSLRPSAEGEFNYGHHPLEKLETTRKVKINQHGFRSPDWPAKKAPGVFRIFFFGGSNTYGASVSNENTYPQKLQALLDKEAPGRFEVWNGGLTAGVLSQAVEYARYAMDNFSPDLVIIQDYINAGRRPFLNMGANMDVPKLHDTEIPRYFKQNPELYLENIPTFLTANESLNRAHRWAVSKSEVYRLFSILINNMTVKLTFPHHYYGNCKYSSEKCAFIAQQYGAYGDMVNEREFEEFKKEYPQLSLLLMDTVRDLFCTPGEHKDRGVPVFSLCLQSQPKEFQEVHPPSYVYDMYAEKILKFLKANHYIPVKR